MPGVVPRGAGSCLAPASSRSLTPCPYAAPAGALPYGGRSASTSHLPLSFATVGLDVNCSQPSLELIFVSEE